MKNKIIYLFFLIFSASMISSAKKTPGTCKISSCSKEEIQKCKEVKKTEADQETDNSLPSLGLFFFNI
jgi:uncharacterized membrane protein